MPRAMTMSETLEFGGHDDHGRTGDNDNNNKGRRQTGETALYHKRAAYCAECLFIVPLGAGAYKSDQQKNVVFL